MSRQTRLISLSRFELPKTGIPRDGSSFEATLPHVMDKSSSSIWRFEKIRQTPEIAQINTAMSTLYWLLEPMFVSTSLLVQDEDGTLYLGSAVVERSITLRKFLDIPGMPDLLFLIQHGLMESLALSYFFKEDDCSPEKMIVTNNAVKRVGFELSAYPQINQCFFPENRSDRSERFKYPENLTIKINKTTDQSVFSNSLVEGRYELGSIMKPLTMAAGIDSGAITARSVYDDTGCITVSTYKICNFDLKARGVIPMQEVLSQSLNLGAAFVATKTGYPTFTKYMKAYGFGQKTGIDLPNEVTGDLSPLGNGQKPAINYDTAAFGQGVSVSPIEMIRALGALANQGVLPNPHVVTAIKYASGITRSIDPGQGPRVLAATTSETVTNMLIKVFDEGLLGGELKMEHYSFAAKTGTAQIPMPGGGYYPGEQYLHSFFGYFPAHDPKFIVFLYAFRPQGQKYASATLAHPFMDIAKYLINYYNIPPDR